MMKVELTREQKIEILGKIGEKYVGNYLAKNRKVEFSLDNFDSEKDLLADGKTVEVKVGTPFITEGAIAFKKSQLTKCRSVDEFYFVTIPAPKYDYRWSGWLFRIENNFKCKVRNITRSNGWIDEMVLVPIEQDAVIPMFKVEDSVINEMMKYTTSKY
jgi:hypothetical protein